MAKRVFFLFILFFSNPAFAQTSKWEVEPSVNVNLFIEAGLSNAIYYSLNRKYYLIAHTGLDVGAFLLDLNSPGAENIKSDYRFYLFQRFGIGKKFSGENKQHGFFALAGPEYRAFKGHFISPNNTVIESSANQLSFSYGFMYALQTNITKSKGFTFKIYLPIRPYTIQDNIQSVSFDLGMRINLK